MRPIWVQITKLQKIKIIKNEAHTWKVIYTGKDFLFPNSTSILISKLT